MGKRVPINIGEKREFTKNLQRDLSNYCNRVAAESCKKAAEDMEMVAMSVMIKFYEDYHPVFYDRTKDLFQNSYFKKYTTNASKVVPYLSTPGKKTYFGGVIVGSRLKSIDPAAHSMSPYKDDKGKPLDPYEVFNAAYQGYHGPIFRPAKIMDESPISILEKYAQIKKNEWLEFGFKMARRYHYSTTGMYRR